MRDKLKNKALQEGVCVLLLGLALGAYSAAGLARTAAQTAWFLSPWLFPLLIAALSLLPAAGLFMEAHRTESAGTDGKQTTGGALCVLGVALLCAAYAFLLPVLHFIPATALLLAALTVLLGERRPWLVSALALALPLLLYAFFGLALQLRLP